MPGDIALCWVSSMIHPERNNKRTFNDQLALYMLLLHGTTITLHMLLLHGTTIALYMLLF